MYVYVYIYYLCYNHPFVETVHHGQSTVLDQTDLGLNGGFIAFKSYEFGVIIYPPKALVQAPVK